MDNIFQYVESAALLAIVLQQLSKALGKLWKQTPGTPDTEVFSRMGKFFHVVQKFLGRIVGDTSSIERARDNIKKDG